MTMQKWAWHLYLPKEYDTTPLPDYVEMDYSARKLQPTDFAGFVNAPTQLVALFAAYYIALERLSHYHMADTPNYQNTDFSRLGVTEKDDKLSCGWFIRGQFWKLAVKLDTDTLQFGAGGIVSAYHQAVHTDIVTHYPDLHPSKRKIEL